MNKKSLKEYKTYLNRHARRTEPDTLAYLSDSGADILLPASSRPSKGYRRVTDADDDYVGWQRRAGS